MYRYIDIGISDAAVTDGLPVVIYNSTIPMRSLAGKHLMSLEQTKILTLSTVGIAKPRNPRSEAPFAPILAPESPISAPVFFHLAHC